MMINRALALEVKTLFEAHYLRHLDKAIRNDCLDECILAVGDDGEYYILITLKKPLPQYFKIPEEYRSLRVITRVV